MRTARLITPCFQTNARPSFGARSLECRNLTAAPATAPRPATAHDPLIYCARRSRCGVVTVAWLKPSNFRCRPPRTREAATSATSPPRRTPSVWASLSLGIGDGLRTPAGGEGVGAGPFSLGLVGCGAGGGHGATTFSTSYVVQRGCLAAGKSPTLAVVWTLEAWGHHRRCDHRFCWGRKDSIVTPSPIAIHEESTRGGWEEEGVCMEAVGRNRTDVSDQVIGEDGGGSEGQTADFQRQLLSFPLLHPLSNSTKQHKERHIVVWCQQEDDLLREQVGIHGTENWTRIAAQFKDKTGRQCRRRWFSYLNTECKKGGWSQEEDLILCEAQKIFGNRWTEIAKVVAGRTDNAVKNRFTTLSKKRTKNESASNENSCSLPPPDDDTCFSQAGCITSVPLESPKSFKKMRYQKLNSRGSSNITGGSLDENEREMRSIRLPLSVLVPKHHNAACLADPQHEAHNLMPLLNDENDLNESEGTFTNELNESEGTFTESSFAEISVLTQEGEPLGSFAQGVSADGSEHSLENAWKELKDYLVQNGDTGLASSETSLVDVVVGEGLADRSRSSSAGSHSSGRPSMIRDHSNFSREHSNTPPNASDAPADSKVFCVEESVAHRDGNLQIFRGDGEDARGNTSEDLELLSCSLDSDATAAMSSCDEPSRNIGIFSTLPNADPNGDSGTFSAFPNDYSSPLQTMPIFRPLSEENSSPKFSASERQFLLSALGLSPSPPSATNPGQQPSCKRALLHSL